MPHWDVSRVTDMSFLFQGKTQFNVDISQWEMSQVTDARGMFEGAASFYQDISGWTFADNATRRGCSRAPTPGSPCISSGWVDTTDGPPAHGYSRPCLENERVESDWCVALRRLAGTNAAGDDPALGVDTGCDDFRTVPR